MKRAAATLLVTGIVAMTGGGIATAAGDYPPNPSQNPVPPATPTTIEVSPVVPTGEELPPTGSDGTMSTVAIAGGLLGAGVVLFGASRRRRHSGPVADVARA